MPMFSCLPSDAEQTSVIPHHRRCWASADSVSRLVAGYVCERCCIYGICRRYYVTAERADGPSESVANRLAPCMTSHGQHDNFRQVVGIVAILVTQTCAVIPSAGPPTQRQQPTRVVIEAGAGAVDASSPRETTHCHNASPGVGRVTEAIRPPGSARAAAAGVILVYRTLWVVACRRRLTAAAAPPPVEGFANPIFITA